MNHEVPEAIEMEKQLPSAMFMKEGIVVPAVLYFGNRRSVSSRTQARFPSFLRLHGKGNPIDYLTV